MNNRVMKFRAYDPHTKEMFLNLDWNKDLGIFFDCEDSCVTVTRSDKDTGDTYSLTPMQFTGLHDKNGKEIYEGDVVKYKDATIDTVAVVGFMDGAFTVEYSEKAILHTTYPYVEILGNIHEHPHLIS